MIHRNILERLLVITIVNFLIVGCVDEDIFESPTELETVEISNIETIVEEDGTEIRYVSGIQLPDVMSQLRVLTKASIVKSGKISFNDTKIYIDSVIEVVGNNGGSNYTFDVITKGMLSNQVFNLIIHRNIDGVLETPYIIAYDINLDSMGNLMESDGNLRYFDTTYTYYTFGSFFSDSKYGKIGKNGNCGRGATGSGATGPPITPGSTFVHSYGSRSVEAIFSSATTGGTYTYSSTIVTNTGSETKAATASSGVVTFPDQTPYGNYTITTHSNTVSVNTTNTGSGGGGGGCPNSTSQIRDSGVASSHCISTGSNTQKNGNALKSSDCPDPQGGYALNGYNRPVRKVFYYLDDSLSWAEINFLADNHGLAALISRFIRDNGQSQEAKDFADAAIDALIAGGDVDFEERWIYDEGVADRLLNAMSNREREIYDDELNDSQKALYLASAVQAYTYAEIFYPRPVRNRVGDAVKHAMWNALSASRIGEVLTKKLTDAHEDITYQFPNHFKETEMDLFNNPVGRDIGNKQSSGIFILVEAAKNSGQLRYLNNLEWSDKYSSYIPTDSSRLINTE